VSSGHTPFAGSARWRAPSCRRYRVEPVCDPKHPAGGGRTSAAYSTKVACAPIEITEPSGVDPKLLEPALDALLGAAFPRFQP